MNHKFLFSHLTYINIYTHGYPHRKVGMKLVTLNKSEDLLSKLYCSYVTFKLWPKCSGGTSETLLAIQESADITLT